MDSDLINIYNKITEISSVDLQRKLWLNENNTTGLVSSYAEVMNSLFDDFGFDNFIDCVAPELGIPDSTLIALNKLRESLNRYVEKGSDKEIIDDPEWKEITRQAQDVLNNWKMGGLTIPDTDLC